MYELHWLPLHTVCKVLSRVHFLNLLPRNWTEDRVDFLYIFVTCELWSWIFIVLCFQNQPLFCFTNSLERIKLQTFIVNLGWEQASTARSVWPHTYHAVEADLILVNLLSHNYGLWRYCLPYQVHFCNYWSDLFPLF